MKTKTPFLFYIVSAVLFSYSALHPTDVTLVYGEGTNDETSVTIPLEVLKSEMPGAWEQLENPQGAEEKTPNTLRLPVGDITLEEPRETMAILVAITTIAQRERDELLNQKAGGNDAGYTLVWTLMNKCFNKLEIKGNRLLNVMRLAEHLGATRELIRCLAKLYCRKTEEPAFSDLPSLCKREVARETLLERLKQNPIPISYCDHSDSQIAKVSRIVKDLKSESGLHAFNPVFSIIELKRAGALRYPPKDARDFHMALNRLGLIGSLQGLEGIVDYLGKRKGTLYQYGTFGGKYEEDFSGMNFRSLSINKNHLKEASLSRVDSNLVVIDLSNNQLTSVDLSDELPNLKELYLGGNELTEISLPSRCPVLHTLCVDLNKLAQIQVPRTYTALKKLFVNDNQLPSLVLPKELSGIEEINLTNNELRKINIPDTFISLKNLSLDGNLLVSLSIPPNILSIEELDAHWNLLTKVALPPLCPHLTVLCLNDNDLASIDLPIELSKLSKLCLRNNKLRSFSLPSSCKDLKHLDVSDNELTSLELPHSMLCLEKLYASHNKLTILRLPTSCPELTIFYADNNLLTAVYLPQDLPKLEHIELGENRIKRAMLPSAPVLDELSLDNNQLAVLDIPDGTSNLEQLYLHNLNNMERTEMHLPEKLPRLSALFAWNNHVGILQTLKKLIDSNPNLVLLGLNDDVESGVFARLLGFVEVASLMEPKKHKVGWEKFTSNVLKFLEKNKRKAFFTPNDIRRWITEDDIRESCLLRTNHISTPQPVAPPERYSTTPLPALNNND